jgi:hypothetical protein
MFSWLKSLRDRWAKRREERRGTAGERALRQNEAKAQRLQHERMDHKDPMAPGL